MSITTNGTLITNRLALTLSKFKPELQFVRVSLDGADPEVHEYIRGRGSYKLVVRGIRHLRANDIPVVVISMIHKRTTFEDVDKMYKLAEELDFDVQYGSIFPVGEALKSWKSIFPSPASLIELSEYILKRQKERGLEDKGIETIEEGEYSLKKTLRRCGVGYKGITVMSNGMLSACYLLPLNKPYEKLLSVWREDLFLRKIRDYTREADVEICQKCKQRNFCFKTCIGASFCVFGDFRDPSPYCILYHEYLNLDEELAKPYLKTLSKIGVDIDE